MSAKDLRFIVDLTARVLEGKRVFLEYRGGELPTVSIRIFFERSDELLELPQDEYLRLGRVPAFQSGEIQYRQKKLSELIEIEVAATVCVVEVIVARPPNLRKRRPALRPGPAHGSPPPMRSSGA